MYHQNIIQTVRAFLQAYACMVLDSCDHANPVGIVETQEAVHWTSLNGSLLDAPGSLCGVPVFESVTVGEAFSQAAWDSYFQPLALECTVRGLVEFEGTHFGTNLFK